MVQRNRPGGKRSFLEAEIWDPPSSSSAQHASFSSTSTRAVGNTRPPCSADAPLYHLRLYAGSASRPIAAYGCNRSATNRQGQQRAEPPQQHRLRPRRREPPVVLALGTKSLPPSYWEDHGPCCKCKEHDASQPAAAEPSHRRPTKRFCKDGWHQRKCRHGGPCDGMERWYCYVPYSPSRAHRPWCW